MAAADTLKEINVEVKRCPDCGARFGIDSAFCPFDGIPLTTSTWDKTLDPRCSSSGTTLTVGDRYEVLEPLGEGGMGTVYKVRHVTLDRYFAMKVLRRDLATDANLATRFVQEARATAAVKHPGVVAITDFGEMEDGIPYFVMELLEGETLSTRIRARGSIDPRTAILIAKQIAEGLAASHDANVIHRDLKPENVFLVGRSVGKPAEAEIRIVDFGAAKIIGGSKLTRPGIVFGTPYYMSPEQASGQEIDGRADIYSLGVLLYEMVTGRVPFEADTYMGVLTKHMFQAPARPSVPLGIQLGALEDVVMRALQKEPGQRYDSMAKLIEALDAAGKEQQRTQHLSRSATSIASSRGTVRMQDLTTADRIQMSVSRRVESEARRRRRMIATVALAACSTFAGGAAILSIGGSSSTLPPAQTTTAKTTTTTATTTTTTTMTAAAALPSITSTITTTTAAVPVDPLPIPTDTSPSNNTGTAVLTPPTQSPTPQPLPTFKRTPPPPVIINTRPHTSPSPTPTNQGTATPQRADDFKDPWKR